MDKALDSHKSLAYDKTKYLLQGIDIVDNEIASAIEAINDGNPDIAKERLEWVVKALANWKIKEDPSGEAPEVPTNRSTRAVGDLLKF